MSEPRPESWAQRQRRSFIVQHVLERGFINKRDLMGKFAISSPQASVTFGHFHARHPDCLTYDASAKRYLKGPGFDDAFTDFVGEDPELLATEVLALKSEVARLSGLLNAPELHDFSRAVVLEGAHQRVRWPADGDAGKSPADWFWLLGYLGGKALAAALAGDLAKAKHHCISSAAMLANWHAALLGADASMRPGIATPEADHG